MSLASDRPEFTPPPAPGRLRAIGLAVLAHILLIAALTWGVSWKRESSSTPIQAELWSATAQEAAPALVEPDLPPPPKAQPKPLPEPKPLPVPTPPKPLPTPTPPKVVAPPEPVVDPQIAIEKEKEKKKQIEKKKALAAEKAKAKAQEEAEAAEEEALQEVLDKKKRLEAKKAEAKKLEAKKAADAKAKEAQEAKDAKAKEAKETAQIAAIRAANLKRMQGLAGASGGETATGTAKQSSGPSAGYGGRVVAKIKPNIVFADDIAGNPVATVEVRCAPDGTILGSRLIKSSGDKAWDTAVLRAITKTEVLPRDIDGRVPSSFEINFRPKD